jgi:hypothetical protein
MRQGPVDLVVSLIAYQYGNHVGDIRIDLTVDLLLAYRPTC